MGCACEGAGGCSEIRFSTRRFPACIAVLRSSCCRRERGKGRGAVGRIAGFGDEVAVALVRVFEVDGEEHEGFLVGLDVVLDVLGEDEDLAGGEGMLLALGLDG